MQTGESRSLKMPEFGIIALTPTAWPDLLEETAIAAAAAQAGGIGVFDLLYQSNPEQAKRLLRRTLAAAPQGQFGIKCSIEQVPEYADITDLLSQQSKTAKQLIILCFAEKSAEKQSLAAVIATLKAKNLLVFCEVICQKEAEIAQHCGADAIIVKGHESSGRIGEETSFVLLQRCMKTVKIPIWLQGGIGLHTAAAAYVGGAQGIVLDSQLLLFPEAALAPETVERLAQFDGTESSPIKTSQGEYFRLWSKTGSPELNELKQELEQIEQSLAGKANDKLNILWRSRAWIQAKVEIELKKQAPFPSLLPIGQDIALSATLFQHFGSVGAVIKGLIETAKSNANKAGALMPLSESAPLAASHGTRYPIVQGAMTRVSDNADFAASIAKEGALPFLALALMRKDEILPLLAETQDKLQDKPWGVGILGFVPQELRMEQLEAIEKYNPPFALIAGGRPDQAKRLEERGIKTYLHVPSPLLLQSFIEMGSKRFIFEGKECGGHVGPRSSFVLWDSMIETMLNAIGPKDKAEEFHVIFAGGIHDYLSAAMVSALALPLSLRGIKVGALMGTAYLFTEEAVASGAIVNKFQTAALNCQETVLFETGPGHAIRCLESPYKNTFDQQRKELEQTVSDRNDIRQELEMMNLGRLRIASKGLARGTTGNKLVPIPEEKQWADGMYMIGQVAALHNQIITIKTLHESVSTSSNAYLNQFQVDDQSRSGFSTNQAPEPIAIVGMSCLFPKANDLETFWENIMNSVDCIEEVPKEHWAWEHLYDQDPLAKDKIYSKWGGFLKDIPFDPSVYGIPPSSLASVDPMQLMILEVTQAALADAGYHKKPFNKERTSVVLANAGHGPITAFYSLRSMLDWTLRDMDPEYKKQLEKRLPEWTEDSFPGYLGNVVAGRIANRFDLGGVNFCIDAACASSLAALHVGIKELRSKTSDIVLLASTDTHNQPGDYLSFSKTHALSPRGRCRTFDATADGIVISEGMAVLMLKRLSDAERDGDRIYALIRGIGGSSDGRDLSLTAPRPAGQMLALRRAYEDACVSPASVELIEAHGTGTVAGDKAEVESLSKVFAGSGAREQNCAIGSVKTMIGHTKCSAGLASVIKIAKSLYHKVLPPTLGVDVPNPSCNFDTSPFYINSEPRPWIGNQSLNEPRRAGISAFGFGGTNFHTVLEEYNSQSRSEQQVAVKHFPTELFIFKTQDKESLIKSLNNLEQQTKQAIAAEEQPHGPLGSKAQSSLLDLSYRCYQNYLNASKSSTDNKEITLSIVAKSKEDLLSKLEVAKKQLEDESKERLHDPRGIFLGYSNSAKPEIAFLFPGQGSQRINMLKDLSLAFKEVRESFETADCILANSFKDPLSRFVFAKPAFNDEQRKAQSSALTDTHVAQPAMAAADLAAFKILRDFGLRPTMLAGHSFGEYVALAAAGSMTEEELLVVAEQRGRILAQSNSRSKQGAMVAVSGLAEKVKMLLQDIPDLSLANINSPKQCIIAGSQEALLAAGKILKESKIAYQPIAVSAAFHSPFMAPLKQELSQALGRIRFRAPSLKVYSNTTSRPYSVDPSSIPALLSEHLVKPVEFQAQIEEMYAAGARIFIECGPGTVLSNLVADILPGKEHLAVSLERNGRHGITQLQMLLGQLHTYGLDLNFSRLFKHRVKPAFSSQRELSAKAPSRSKLTYLINSANVKKLDGTRLRPKESAQTNDSATAKQESGPQPQLSAAAKNFEPPKVQNNLAAQTPSTREQMLLDFQRNMFQMTQNFIESQERVMLAYLQNTQAGVAPTSTPLPQALVDFQNLTARSTPTDLTNIKDRLDGLPRTNEPQPAKATENNGHLHQAEDQNLPSPGKEGENPEALIAALIEIVSERTGYPPDMLDPTLDMEADLGIDSIKRVEILNSFRKLLPESKQLNLEDSVEKLAGTKTLQGIMEWIRNDLFNNEVCVKPENQAKEQTNNQAPVSVKTQQNSEISRAQVGVRKIPVITDAANLAPGTYIVTDDGFGFAQSICASLQELGCRTVLLRHSEDPACRTEIQEDTTPDLQKFAVNLLDHNQIDGLLNRIESAGHKVLGLIHLLPLAQNGYSTSAFSSSTADSDYLPVRTTFTISKALQKRLTGLERFSFMAATALGGDFGSSEHKHKEFNPIFGGVTGILKTNGREHPQARVRTIDFPPSVSTTEVAKAFCLELRDWTERTEVGYLKGERYETYVESVPLIIEQADEKLHLDPTSVVLVTGGARGITAEVCIGLAVKYKPTFIIVGRGQRPLQPEAREFQGLHSARELKSAIMETLRNKGESVSIPSVEAIYQTIIREREIRDNLERLEKCGSKVKYYSLDVRNEAAFADVIRRVYDSFGKIDGVIHGAGVIEDALVKDKELASFDRVFHTKVDSALILSNNLQLDSLKFLALFSSVVGRTGNAGQSDYVAANEVLNKLAQLLQTKTNARVASIMWGPWRGGMAQAALEPVFAKYGWSMIEPDDGQRSFEAELFQGNKKNVEMLLVGQIKQDSGGSSTELSPASTYAPEGVKIDGEPLRPCGARLHQARLVDLSEEEAEFSLRLDPKFDLYLNDHTFDGTPVLPMTMALELMAEAAQALYPDWYVSQVQDLQIPAGIVFEMGAKDLRIVARKLSQDKNKATVGLSICSNKALPVRTNFRANILLTKEKKSDFILEHGLLPASFSAPHLHDTVKNIPSAAELYEKWLFHGPLFQGIDRIKSMGANGIYGELHTVKPQECLTASNSDQWLIDPILLDSAMQLGGVWARHYMDITALPTGFKSIRRIAQTNSNVFTAIVSVPHDTKGTELVCDLAIYDDQGQMIIYMEGLTGVGSKSLNRLANQPKVVKSAR